MCGIAGFLNGASNELTRDLGEVSSAMDISLQHRGPDDHGVWIDESAGVALVHRRLSILDLSPAGHQPMISADGRFVIIYNGEVYSYQPIAAELAASGLSRRVAGSLRPPQAGDKLYKLAAVLKLDSADALYRRLVSHWEPSEIVLEAHEPRTIIADETLAKEFPDLMARMQFLDLVSDQFQPRSIVKVRLR